MKQLTIEDATVRFRINGIEFSFVADSEFSLRLSELAREASERADLCGSNEIYDGSEATAFLCYAIDSLIGDGTIERIFGDTCPDPIDLCDILGIISEAFHEYRTLRLNRIKEGLI